MKTVLIYVFLVISSFFSVAAPAGAQAMKKCTDANGKITFSDRECPANAASATFRTAAADAAPPAAMKAKIPDDMKTLYHCEKGKKDACFAKETLDKRCALQHKAGPLLSDCLAYTKNRNKFRELYNRCDRDKEAGACAEISCFGGDANSCNRMQETKESAQQAEKKRIDVAAKTGMPAGKTWYMSQDWRDKGNGEKSAIVTCNPTTSIVLAKKAGMEQRIYLHSTSGQYFLSVDEAASKGCSEF